MYGSKRHPASRTFTLLALPLALACATGEDRRTEAEPEPPSILLVTLDTTRADAVEPEAEAVETPALAALADAGVRFTQAYSTVPETLPAHASMLTGLYPAGHGVHENSRRLGDGHELLTVRLASAGYTTAAFVSGAPLLRQFGLARGFGHYDDRFGGGAAERRADATTAVALEYLEGGGGGPLFLWVHYYDPHDPYDPPEPYRSRYPDAPYLGEIAFMDHELGRLVEGFRARAGDGGHRILVVGDHGEGLGDHGEALHGNLLYQGVMRVPLIVADSGVDPRVESRPVSIRDVFDTVTGWAAGETAPGLLRAPEEPVLAEAMKPYLQYGWRPQVMGVLGRHKVILAGDRNEIYDVIDDPAEEVNLAERTRVAPALAQAVREYPVPAPGAEMSDALSEDERRQLASLGYVTSDVAPAVRQDAPVPAEMTHLFADLDLASGLFVRKRHAEAIPVLQRVHEQDPGNLMVVLRLAVAHSVLGQASEAMESFERARELAPGSPDVEQYLGLHWLRMGEWERAAPLLEKVVAAQPHRLPAVEGLARVRQHQGRATDAVRLLEDAVELDPDPAPLLAALGGLHMQMADTPAAIEAFERARDLQGGAFRHHLELGVLYLAARRLEDARASLDRVSSDHPAYPMALFKRAQVSVLLEEPDQQAHIQAARDHADATTRPLIERESLFRGAQ